MQGVNLDIRGVNLDIKGGEPKHLAGVKIDIWEGEHLDIQGMNLNIQGVSLDIRGGEVQYPGGWTWTSRGMN